MSDASVPPDTPDCRGAEEGGVVRHGFPGLDAQYVAVGSDKLGIDPYHAIGQVICFDCGGAVSAVGTGWLWSGGLVVTAAHVLHGSAHAECRLPDGTVGQWDKADDLHPGFVDANGVPRVGSPQDIAVMPVQGAAGSGIDVALGQSPNTVMCAGFPGRNQPMVEHAGDAWQAGRYFGHGAHTRDGHSGAALIANGTAVGLHVGIITLVRRWQPQQPIQERDGANAAVIFDQSLINFLNSRIR